MVETILYARLSGYSGLTALVGDRIHPVILPEGVTYPAVTYQRISTYPRDSSMSVDNGLVRARFQISIWADTYASVKSVKEQVRGALQRYTTTGLQGSYLVSENDLYDEDALKYGVAIDFELVYMEA